MGLDFMTDTAVIAGMGTAFTVIPRGWGQLTVDADDRAVIQESPAVADKPARRLRKVCTVYVRAVGLTCIARLPIDSLPTVSYYVLYSNYL